MSNFRPIAMRCTQEQFDAIKPKLTNLLSKILFTKDTYLVNNLSGEKGVISNVPTYYNREVHEEWNERMFLEACGIETETLQEKATRLENELEEVKALIEEENKPKIGDICKLWNDDKSIFIVGELICIETGIYRYYADDDTGFKNCEKITDENFLKAFDSL